MKTEKLGEYYMHINNGGLTMELSALYDDNEKFESAELKIENSFYGYMSNSMTLYVGEDGEDLSGNDLRAMADFLNNMALKLDSEGKK